MDINLCQLYALVAWDFLFCEISAEIKSTKAGNGVCYIGCKLPEIERNRGVVVSARTTPADGPSKYVARPKLKRAPLYSDCNVAQFNDSRSSYSQEQ